jgi:carbonic anhydrase
LRSLIVSTRVLGSREIMIINHTGCGMQTFKDDELEARLEQQTGTATIVPESRSQRKLLAGVGLLLFLMEQRGCFAAIQTCCDLDFL